MNLTIQNFLQATCIKTAIYFFRWDLRPSGIQVPRCKSLFQNAVCSVTQSCQIEDSGFALSVT